MFIYIPQLQSIYFNVKFKPQSKKRRPNQQHRHSPTELYLLFHVISYFIYSLSLDLNISSLAILIFKNRTPSPAALFFHLWFLFPFLWYSFPWFYGILTFTIIRLCLGKSSLIMFGREREARRSSVIFFKYSATSRNTQQPPKRNKKKSSYLRISRATYLQLPKKGT